MKTIEVHKKKRISKNVKSKPKLWQLRNYLSLRLATLFAGVLKENTSCIDSLMNPSLLANFKIYCDVLRNLINTAKNNYYNNLFQFAAKMKTTWRRINSVLCPSRINPKLKLEVNDEMLTEQKWLIHSRKISLVSKKF